MRLANMLHLLPVGTGIAGAMHRSAVYTNSEERQDLYCMYPAHHELESVKSLLLCGLACIGPFGGAGASNLFTTPGGGL